MGSKQLIILKSLLSSIDQLSEQLDNLNQLALEAVKNDDDGTYPDELSSLDWQVILGKTAQMKRAHQQTCNGSVILEKIIKL